MLTKKILAQPSLTVGLLLVLVFALVALAAPLIISHDGRSPYTLPKDGFGPQPLPPRPGYPLGTLEGGGDVFYGLIWGTRAAFRIGLIITAGRMIAGILLGLIAGYYGGAIDATLMRITDAFLSFPIMAGALVLIVLFGGVLYAVSAGGQPEIFNRVERVIIISLILFGWMPYARLIRGNILVEREREYMQAARASGVRNSRIMFRHLLPNVTNGLFVLIASDVGAMVVMVAAFNFIGFGVPSKGELQADWGQMLSVARNWIIGTPSNAFEYWYTYLPVSAAIVLFSIGWSLVGDGLRNALDPRAR